MVKYIVVTGGVLSGLGKGVIASSTGVLLKALGFSVTSIKIDPYLNIDAGLMSPFEHGEVFVLDDGGEVDLDLGNYERFLNITLGRDNNITTGKIYNKIIQKERKGEYLGKTVQVVPHVCNEIQDWIQKVALTPLPQAEGTEPVQPEFCIIELGGTVGDIESMPYVEALRQFQFRVGRENFCSIHVSLVPVMSNEQKTKPTQQSVRELRALGISPDIVVCRSSVPLTKEIREKLSLFCHVDPENVIGCHDVSNIYQVPLLLRDQHFDKLVLKRLHSKPQWETSALNGWIKFAQQFDEVNNNKDKAIHIAMVGKYTGLPDSYQSIIKALQHSSVETSLPVQIDWIDSTELSRDPNSSSWEVLRKANGILVPGGFGDRGVEGKILAIKYARENKVPFLGICLGMQLAVIEFTRNVLGLPEANSEEFDTNAKPRVVIFMPEVSKTHMGATMRLGRRPTLIRSEKYPNSLSQKLYNNLVVEERHRHRYEVNPEMVPSLEAAGLNFVGQDDTEQRMEIVELPTEVHPFFYGTQYHPEFLSRPGSPSPPFVGFVLASAGKLSEFISLLSSHPITTTTPNNIPSTSPAVSAPIAIPSANSTATPAPTSTTPSSPVNQSIFRKSLFT